MEISKDNLTTRGPISRVDAVITSMDDSFIELQLAGSYETIQWPRKSLERSPNVGEKILLELKNHPLTDIQKVVEKAVEAKEHDHASQRKLLEKLIN